MSEKEKQELIAQLNLLNNTSDQAIDYRNMDFDNNIEAYKITAEVAPRILRNYFIYNEMSLSEMLNIEYDIMDDTYWSGWEHFRDFLKMVYIESVKNRSGLNEKISPSPLYNYPINRIKEYIGIVQYIGATIDTQEADQHVIEYLTKHIHRTSDSRSQDIFIEAIEEYKNRKTPKVSPKIKNKKRYCNSKLYMILLRPSI